MIQVELANPEHSIVAIETDGDDDRLLGRTRADLARGVWFKIAYSENDEEGFGPWYLNPAQVMAVREFTPKEEN